MPIIEKMQTFKTMVTAQTMTLQDMSTCHTLLIYPPDITIWIATHADLTYLPDITIAIGHFTIRAMSIPKIGANTA